MKTKQIIRCWQVGAGPRSMLQSAKKMKQRSAFLALRSLSADIRWVFETSSLDRSVEIHSSSVEAIAAVINWRAIKFETPMKVTDDNHRRTMSRRTGARRRGSARATPPD